HAPQFVSAINQTIKKVIGSSVDLDCDVDAAPLPTKKWTDLDGNQFEIDGEKRQLLENGTLRINHLRLYDSDTYFCDVVNKFGMNQARRVLDIYKPTYFTLQLETNEKSLVAGDDVELICAAESDERLKIDYIWTKNDRRLNNGDDRTQFREQNRLRLTNIAGKDSGLYACTAQTEVDEIRTEMKLIVKDVPDAPMITNVQCMETQALIKWTASSDNNDKIKEYFVEYETNFHPGVWKSGLIEKSSDSKNEYEAAINLSPWVVHSFRVSAANSFGRGLPGYIDHVKCRTSPSIPFTNPDNVTVYGTKKDNLIINWQVRLRNEDWHEVQIEDPEQNVLEIDGVPTYKKFEVQVRARNSAGLSNKIPFIVYGFSGQDVPSVAPEKFRVVESNATHVLFAWDPINEQFLNGPLAGYFVKVWPISQVRKRSVVGLTWEIFVPPNQNKAFVKDLKPMKSYAANLVASNSKYNSTPSEIVRFATPEGLIYTKLEICDSDSRSFNKKKPSSEALCDSDFIARNIFKFTSVG
uniref:Uncharacterized protein n=1 Tax=Romanomermis culicivorax TaxID=13658 RepID=A0A915HKY2_ROMCU